MSLRVGAWILITLALTGCAADTDADAVAVPSPIPIAIRPPAPSVQSHAAPPHTVSAHTATSAMESTAPARIPLLVNRTTTFGYSARPLGSFGSLDYSGSRVLSEPESVAAANLIRRIHPPPAIWLHQHLAVVDDSQGPTNIERQFSALVGLRLARLTDYPGSVAGWQDSMFGPTAFVVELPAGHLAYRHRASVCRCDRGRRRDELAA